MDNDSIYLALGRIEGKLEALIKQQEVLTEGHDELHTRIRAVETALARAKGVWYGAAAVISALFGLVVNLYHIVKGAP